LIYFSGFSGSILPAKIGELIRVYLMKKRGISIKKTFACHVSTVLTILISSLLILLVMLFLSLQPILVKALIILTILILIILFVLKSKFVFNIVSSVLKKISWTKKFLNESSNAHSTLRYMLKVKNFIVTVPFSSIAWLMDSMIVYFILIGLGASITIIQAIIVLVLVSVAGSFSMLPGGFLIAEGGFFSLLILYNTPIPIAAMATILIRLVTFWFKIFYGFIALHIYNQRIKRLELHP